MDQQQKTTCSDCEYFKPIPLQPMGFCKRFPPQLLINQQGMSSTPVPVPKILEACGEFKPMAVISLNQQ